MSFVNDWRARAAKLPGLVETPTRIGVLRLPTGRIILGEPISSLVLVPLTRIAPIGEFPVEIAFVTVEPKELRIGAARIVFSRQPIASWELASGASNAATPAPDGSPGYTGPAGMFMDVQTAPLFRTYADGSESGEWWSDVPKEQGHIWEYACFQPDEQTPYNCAYMSPLLSENVFVSYWGLDAVGEPVALVSDFNVAPM